MKDILMLHKNKTKKFGHFLSPRLEDLKTDNVLTCLYISKFVNKNDSLHMKQTILQWKKLIPKNIPLVPSEKLGKTLKMNIRVDLVNLYNIKRKSFTDVDLSKSNNGLYRPIITLDKLKGGCNQAGSGGVAPAMSKATTLQPKKGVVGESRQNVPAMRNIEPPSNELIQICSMELDEKHRMIFDSQTYNMLIELDDLNEPSDEEKRKLDIVIKAGYCWNTKNGMIQQSLDKFYTFNVGSNQGVTGDTLPPNKRVTPEEQQQKLYKLIYSLHSTKGIKKDIYPIVIINALNGQVGGADSTLEELTEQNLNADHRRRLHFIMFKDPRLEGDTIKVVVKIGNFDDDEPYRTEATNYEHFTEYHKKLQETANYNGKTEENVFFNSHITKYYNSGVVDKKGNFHIIIDDKVGSSSTSYDFKFITPAKRILSPKDKKVVLFNTSYKKNFYLIIEHDDTFQTADDMIHNISFGVGLTKTETKTKQVAKITSMNDKVIETLYQAKNLYGFYHGDLKVDNVLVNRFGLITEKVKIFDLDFSGFIYAESDLTMDVNSRSIDFPLFQENIDKIERFNIDIFNTFAPQSAKDLPYLLHALDIWRMFYAIVFTSHRWGIKNLKPAGKYSNLWNLLMSLAKKYMTVGGDLESWGTWQKASDPIEKIALFLKQQH